MIVISDTNILSSLAAASALALLEQLFPNAKIFIPPSVRDELQTGLDYGKTYLTIVLESISTNDIGVLKLSHEEEQLSTKLPNRLNAGECEGIVLAQNRDLLFLSNDRRAVRYCHNEGILVLDLADILRLLWLQEIRSRDEVAELIQKMTKIEKLVLRQVQMDIIFASRSN